MNNVAIVTFTLEKAGIIPLSHLVDIVNEIYYNNTLIITSESYDSVFYNSKINYYQIKHEGGGNPFSRILKFSLNQLKISYRIIKISNDFDFLILFMGGELLILPTLVSKILNKKIFILLASSHIENSKINKDYLSILTNWICKITFYLSNYIFIYSSLLIKKWNLKSYENKIKIAKRHFINFDKFKIEIEINNRQNLIGYIGRLSPEKGVMNFINAIPLLLIKNKDLEFIVIGDGKLKNEIKDRIKQEKLGKKIKLVDWLNHNELPDYLNNLKLMVLPSYTEGLPNIILESMACGTPVLATSVGAIPDLIIDGKTGFIMDNNSPKCIEYNITRALQFSNIHKIVSNARLFVETNYNFEAAVESYKEIFDEFKQI